MNMAVMKHTGIIGLAGLIVLLIVPGCSSEEDWEQTLLATAPENPNRLSRVESPEPQERNESDAQRPVQPNPGPLPDAQPRELEQIQPAVLTIIVDGIDSCRFGAVRCLLDSKYKGALDDDGRLTLELPAGVYQGELVDSEGQWLFVATLQPGSSNEVRLSCANKTYFGEASLQSEDEN